MLDACDSVMCGSFFATREYELLARGHFILVSGQCTAFVTTGVGWVKQSGMKTECPPEPPATAM